MVCQHFLEANQKSFSIGSLTSSHRSFCAHDYSNFRPFSEFHVPSLPRDIKEIGGRWELNTSRIGASTRHTQFSLTTCLGLTSLSGSLSCQSTPGGNQLTALLLFSSECPKHSATNLMIWPQSWSSIWDLRCSGTKYIYEHTMFKHGVCYGQSKASKEVQ